MSVYLRPFSGVAVPVLPSSPSLSSLVLLPSFSSEGGFEESNRCVSVVASPVSDFQVAVSSRPAFAVALPSFDLSFVTKGYSVFLRFLLTAPVTPVDPQLVARFGEEVMGWAYFFRSFELQLFSAVPQIFARSPLPDKVAQEWVSQLTRTLHQYLAFRRVPLSSPSVFFSRVIDPDPDCVSVPSALLTTLGRVSDGQMVFSRIIHRDFTAHPFPVPREQSEKFSAFLSGFVSNLVFSD